MNQQGNATNTEVETITARTIQQKFLEDLGDRDWDEFTSEFKHLIIQKVAYAIHGPPQQESDLYIENNVNSTFGYSQEQLKEVLPIFQKICQFDKYSPDHSSIYMSVIFICCIPTVKEVKNIHILDNHEYPINKVLVFPVFRIRKCIKIDTSDSKFGCCVYIDNIGRLYKTWDSYLKDNKLPEGILVAPENGRYSGLIIDNEVHVKLQIELSPSSKPLAKAKNVADVVSTGVAFGALGVLAFTLFAPVAAPVMVATAVASTATGAYGMATSTVQLHDRKTHDQSINLADSEARACWLNLAASSTGVVAGAASKTLSTAVQRGAVIGKGLQIAHDAAIVAATLSSGMGLANSIFNCVMRYRETGQRPTNLEIFQLASSLLFFTNSIMSNRMASTIIEETQTSQITNYRDSLRSNRHRKIYDKMVAETRRVNGERVGNAEVIKTNLRIENKDQFFQETLRLNKQFNEHQVRISMRDGQAVLNGEHIINPQEFGALSLGDRASYLSSIGPANLSTRNVSTNYTSTAVSTPITIPIRPILSSVMTVSKLINSFPELNGTDENLLKYIAAQMTTFINENVYDKFLEILRYLESHMDLYMREQIACLGINGTDLLLRIFNFLHQYFKNMCGSDNAVSMVIEDFFENGLIRESNVLQMLTFFRSQLRVEYEEMSRSEIRCKFCNGLTFCTN